MKPGDIVRRLGTDGWFLQVTEMRGGNYADGVVLIPCGDPPRFTPAGQRTGLNFGSDMVIRTVPEDEVPEHVWAALARLRMKGDL